MPETGLWQDVAELAESLTATLDAREGFDDAAESESPTEGDAPVHDTSDGDAVESAESRPSR